MRIVGLLLALGLVAASPDEPALVTLSIVGTSDLHGAALPGDRRGAIKARAAQAKYPVLAANLIDDATGRPVAWANVRPSVLVDAAGVKVGIVGVVTIDALQSTIAANVHGLHVAPLAP